MERDIMTAGQYHDTGNARQRWNRTAGVTVLGGVGFVDYTQSDTASSGATDPIRASMENVVAVTTALIATRPKLVVCAEAGCADDAVGKWLEGEDFIADVNVDSTTDIAVGDWLKPVNAGDHLVKATQFSVDETGAAAAESLVPVYAQALQARTANNEGTIKARVFSNGLIF